MRKGRWLAALAAAGAATLVWRRGRSRRHRVDLYFEDGSMIALGGDTDEAKRLLALAGDALAAARR
jgi:hypothetical protein